MVAIKIEQDDFPSAPVKIKSIKEDIKNMKLKLGKSDYEINGSKIAPKNKRVAKWSHLKPTLHEHRCRLMMLIDKLAKKHEWRDVSGALSVLFKGTPRGCSLMEDRKHFMLAMEVLRRVPHSQGHTRKIKQIFDVWMSKLPWARKCSMKKHLIQMELALFCLMQDNIKEAHQTMKFLAQDPESGNDPHVHLIHGLTSYQIWYSELPQEMKVKDFDVFMQPDDSITFLNDGPPQHLGFLGRSCVHDSSNIQCAEIYAPSNSESSIGDVKAPAECNLKSQDRHKYKESTDEDTVDFHSNVINTANVSIFHTHGLDACLLPIRLHESIEEDTESMIISHKRLLNQHYMDALKHLKAALHSNPPMLSALHPLMQLLLIGDQVEEALEELDEFFRTSKSMLPLRYKVRLLECLGDGQYAEIAKCHEQIVEIDPNHVSSLKRLIKLNMDGNYPTIQLVEYLALHMDHTDGDSSMWEVLASCFLKIQSLHPSEYEEEEESTTRAACLGLLTIRTTTFTRIPKALTGVESRNLWIYRCKWWHKRHFSKGIYTSELQTGDMQRMVYKAACACHVYGPDFKYVTELMLDGNRGPKSLIQQHRNSSLKLYQSLTMDNPF